ncbi:MAG: N-acetylmuramoyl-L-alanine amidase [Clostridia bacterium]|nr:N-acetylmuramoyl-L-alanine amidase [Clostridia bacterium]
MPTVYLSPSTQEYNAYYDGVGNEEYYMNLIADEIVPYLQASGIDYYRNTPEMTAASSIRQSNGLGVDLHVALHSNAAPESISGQLTGTDVYYYPSSRNSTRFARIVVENLRRIYPEPDKVRMVSGIRIGEVARTDAPAVLIEFAYHDNPRDAEWIRNNIGEIARAVALSIAQYFGLPLVEPDGAMTGVVRLSSGYLNIRSMPGLNGSIIGRAFDGDELLVFGEENGFYTVRFNGTDGFASKDYIYLRQ